MVATLAEVGQLIASARKQKAITQEQLAHSAGVSRATVDLLENGRASEIGYSKLVRLLTALGLELRVERTAHERPTLEDLLNEESDRD